MSPHSAGLSYRLNERLADLFVRNLEIFGPENLSLTKSSGPAGVIMRTLAILGVLLLPLVGRASEPRFGDKVISWQTPPFGLKVYQDLGLMIDESQQASELPKSGEKSPLLLMSRGSIRSLTKRTVSMIGLGGQKLPGGDQPFDDPEVLWCAYSKDGGQTWSEPRFLAASVFEEAIRDVEMKKGKGEDLVVTVEIANGRRFEIRLKEYDLRRLATMDDLLKAPEGRLVIKSVPPDNKDLYLQSESLCIGRDISFPLSQPPAGYKLRKDLGLLVQDSMEGQVVHTAQSKQGTLYETRAVVTPKGDYMIFIPDGSHGNSTRPNANILTSYRSSDQGKTWQGPAFPLGKGSISGCCPSLPKGSQRIFVYESLRDVEVEGKTRERTLAIGIRTMTAGRGRLRRFFDCRTDQFSAGSV